MGIKRSANWHQTPKFGQVKQKGIPALIGVKRSAIWRQTPKLGRSNALVCTLVPQWCQW